MADRWDLLAGSFRRSMRARNLSPKTELVYMEAVGQLGTHLLGLGIHDPADVAPEHVQGFLIGQLERLAPATVNNRFRALQQWFAWLLEEEEIETNPMARLKPPKVPETLVPVLSEEQLAALFKTCAGRDFAARRDLAMLRLFYDTGVRRGGMAGILVEDVSLDDQVVLVVLKGGAEHMLAFGTKTAAALDRYLRARSKERQAGLPQLWLGAKGKGALTADGIAQMLERRGREAGIEGRLHPHQFRHTFASAWLEQGGSETDLMQLAGWKSRQMLGRYGASAAASRARAAHRRMGLGDRF